jgi:RNA polymerase sigma factor (sigma-70 family)
MTESDIQLLREWTRLGSEEAFATVVRRHVNLVFSSALRQVGSRELAEEITQAVFFELAKSARALRQDSVVAAWLFEVTRRKAIDLLRREARRKERERLAVEEATSMNSQDASWREIAPMLDEAMAKLATKDRAALLLRFFENQGLRDVGQSLGISEDAAQKRVARALEKLRQILELRGVSATTPGLATMLAAHSVEAAPAAFASGIVPAAVAATKLFGYSANLSLLAMTKTQGTVLGVLLAGFAIPLGLQNSQLQRLRAVTASAHTMALLNVSNAVPQPDISIQPETNELERLRKLADDLRSQIAARWAVSPGSNAGPRVLLAIGVETPLADLVHAGNETAEAALQSILAFQRDANLEGVFSLMIIRPSNIGELNDALSKPETKEELAARMRNALFGARISHAVERLPDGSVSGPRIREEWPDSPGEVRVKILENEVIDERRVRLKVELKGGAEMRLEHYTFGLTSSGWKQVF